MSGPVVVGIDNSEHSARTTELAASEAMARGVPLHLVHVYRWLPSGLSGAPDVPFNQAPADVVRAAAVDLLEDAARQTRIDHPGLVVETVPLEGDPPPRLAEAARGASLLVVGGRGQGGFAGLLLGSTALRLLPIAECPVMVVRGEDVPHSGRVMVGVDLLSSQQSADALEFAFAEAVRRRAEIYAVYVWENSSNVLDAYARLPRGTFSDFEQVQRNRLAAVLEPLKTRYPGVVVTQDAFPGTVSRALVDSTRLMGALVIGGDAPSDEKRPGMRVGALAHIVLHHAHCPVFVVPEH